MRYLVPAFIGEGPTDFRFLEPLILRMLRGCLQRATDVVEIQTPIRHLSPATRRQADIVDSLRTVAAEVDLIFLHTDGGGDPGRAMQERVTPIFEQLRHIESMRCIGIVPVHETEAWVLVDGDALRTVFGTTRSNMELGLPRSALDVEALADPKAVLRQTHDRVTGARRRRRQMPLGLLGEHVALDRLRRLGAFRAFENELAAALRTSGLIT